MVNARECEREERELREHGEEGEHAACTLSARRVCEKGRRVGDDNGDGEGEGDGDGNGDGDLAPPQLA